MHPLLTSQDGQSHSLVSNERVLILMPKPLFLLASKDMTKEYHVGNKEMCSSHCLTHPISNESMGAVKDHTVHSMETI